MAIFLHSVSNGCIPPFEYLPCGSDLPKAGLAMKLTGGKLEKATGATKPSHICKREGESANGSYTGELIPAVAVDPGITFGTTNSAAFTAVKAGDKVQLSADGLSVSATTTSGVAEVTGFSGTDIGSYVKIKF